MLDVTLCHIANFVLVNKLVPLVSIIIILKRAFVIYAAILSLNVKNAIQNNSVVDAKVVFILMSSFNVALVLLYNIA